MVCLRYENYSPMIVGERIRNIRENKYKLNRKDFMAQLHSNGIDVAEDTFKKWETGDVTIKTGNLVKLCRMFNCEIDYLFGEQELKTKAETDINKITGLSPEATNFLINPTTPFIKEIINNFVVKANEDYVFFDYLHNYKEAVNCRNKIRSTYHPLVVKGLFEVGNTEKVNPDPDINNFERNLSCYFETISDNDFQDVINSDSNFRPSSERLDIVGNKRKYAKHLAHEEYYSVYFAVREDEFRYALMMGFTKLIDETILDGKGK